MTRAQRLRRRTGANCDIRRGRTSERGAAALRTEPVGSPPMTTFRSTCAAAALAAALLLSAGAVSAAPAMPPGVAAALRSSGLPISSFGIDIRSVDVGASDDLFALNAEQDFLLASTTKLVTSLAALDLLGPDHRWRTGAFATGPVANGRLTGDLVISGGAVGLTSARDAALVPPDARARPGRGHRQHRARPCRAAARARSGAGADDRGREPAERGVPDPKTYNVGKLLVSVKPADGERATVIVKPRPANVVVVNDVFMGGGCGAWARWRSAEETRGGAPLQLWVRGRWDKTCGAEDIAYVRPPEDVRLAPELGAAPAAPVAAPRLVADLWAEAGGKLRGRVVEGGEPAAGRRAAGRPLVERGRDPAGRGDARDEQDQQQPRRAQRAAVARQREGGARRHAVDRAGPHEDMAAHAGPGRRRHPRRRGLGPVACRARQAARDGPAARQCVARRRLAGVRRLAADRRRRRHLAQPDAQRLGERPGVPEDRHVVGHARARRLCARARAAGSTRSPRSSRTRTRRRARRRSMR